MSRPLHVVLTCTKRKRSTALNPPRLRDVEASDINTLSIDWIERIKQAEPCHAAADLYSGEYWQQGMALARAVRVRFSSRVWVLSAGLGLIDVTEFIPNYSATLVSGDPDSVARGWNDRRPSEVRREWWSALSQWPGPANGGPRTLAEVTAEQSGAQVLLCGGRDYVDAVADDLRSLQSAQEGEGALMIFASGSPLPGLHDAWVRVPGRLRLALGGSQTSTTVRTATAVIESLLPHRLNPPAARSATAAFARTTPPLPVFARRRMSDAEIVNWVRDHRSDHSGVTKSTALRVFRDEGLACEQGRFGRLFEDSPVTA